MRINLLFILFVLIASIKVVAQKVSLSVSSGVATYAMNSLKVFNQDLVSQNIPGLKLTLTNNFPPYLYYQGQLVIEEGKNIFDFAVGHGSTGSRYAYGDYSGEYGYNDLVNYNYISIRVGENFISENNFTISVNVRGTFNLNKLKIQEDITIAKQYDETSQSFHSFNYGIQPFFSAKKTYSKFYLKADVGYEYQMAGKLYLDHQSAMYLVNSSNGEVVLNNNDFRFNVGVGYYLN